MKIIKLETKKQKTIAGLAVVLGVSAIGGGAYLYSQKVAEGGLGIGKNLQQGPEDQDLNLPDRDSDIMGIVESVKGNQITVLKLDSSSMPQVNKDEASGDNVQKKERPSGDMPQGERPTGAPANGASGQRPTGGASDTMISELKAKSIGTETITVPVGIAIYKESGMGQWKEATIADITANTMVTIWLNQDVAEGGSSIAQAVKIGMGGGK